MASLTTPTVKLFVNNITVTPDTVFASLVEPSGDWYTPQSLTYGQVFEGPNGEMNVVARSVQFNYTGTDAAETIYGWFVDDAGDGDAPISARNLETPVNMGNVLDSLIVQPGLTLPPVPQVV